MLSSYKLTCKSVNLKMHTELKTEKYPRMVIMAGKRGG